MPFYPSYRRLSLSYRAVIAALLLGSSCAQADFAIPGFELVHTVPVGSDLQTPDLRAPGETSNSSMSPTTQARSWTRCLKA